VDTLSNLSHCGWCGNVCPPRADCADGACVCPNAETLCTDTCVDTLTDAANCNGCGKACPDTAECLDAKCVCPGDESLCDDQCVDTDTDEANCGGCGKPCIGGTCTAGKCVCPKGETNCDGTCADLDVDKQHCGSCDVACSDAEICGVPEDSGAGGAAGAAGAGGNVTHECVCPPDREDCDGVCADLNTDSQHCGACNIACPGDKICTDADCVCAPGTEDCGGGTCANLSTDKDHCGDCDTACPSNQICKSGDCGCPSGLSLCGSTCVDLENDDDHCGTCTHACAGTEKCWGGECLRGPCDKLCSPAENVAEQSDGFRVEPLGSGTRCLEVKGYAPTKTNPRIVCWNLDGSRTLRVNGTQVACVTGEGVPVGDPRGGGYCVQVTPGPNPNNAGLILPTL
jgi:hypothetical protein